MPFDGPRAAKMKRGVLLAAHDALQPLAQEARFMWPQGVGRASQLGAVDFRAHLATGSSERRAPQMI